MDVRPFDIVTSSFNNLYGNTMQNNAGKLEHGLFLVIAVHDDNTLTALKITSNPNNGNTDNNYELRIDSHPFLQTTSYVQCDKFHSLFCNYVRPIGSMIDFCRRGFISRFTLVLGQFRLGLEKYAPEYISPNRK